MLSTPIHRFSRAIRTVAALRCCLSELVRPMVKDIDASKLTIKKSAKHKKIPEKSELSFGRNFSDHMLVVDWSSKSGWKSPIISPYKKFSIDPAASVFHYATECFEGLKAYKDTAGNVRLFRPDMNMKRMNRSMTRLFFPNFSGTELIKLISSLLEVDQAWVPSDPECSLYIRPTAIATHPFLGVGKSDFVRLYCILSPVAGYYSAASKTSVKLLADTTHARAWPGGVGGHKLGSNYGPTIYPNELANHADPSVSQILWLHGPRHEITEVGAMNVFFVFAKSATEWELATAPLDRSDVLPGVTRDSVLTLARRYAAESDIKVTVSERYVEMGEVVNGVKSGSLIEAFGAGTAAVISPIHCISFKGQDLNLPTDLSKLKTKRSKLLSTQLYKDLTDIQYGRVIHDWSVVAVKKTIK